MAEFLPETPLCCHEATLAYCDQEIRYVRQGRFGEQRGWVYPWQAEKYQRRKFVWTFCPFCGDDAFYFDPNQGEDFQGEDGG